MTSDEVIATLVQTLSETFRTAMTPPAARGYLLALKGLSADELRAAGERALKECEFMPAPATLLKFGRQYRRSLEPTEVELTNLRLEAMKAPPPTAAQLKEMSGDWKKVVEKLAKDKS